MTEISGGSAGEGLEALLEAVDRNVLVSLVRKLAAKDPAVCMDCLQFLRQHAELSPEAEATVVADQVWALWEALEPDLEELDTFGGGDDDQQGRVADLLYQISQKLEEETTPSGMRQELPDV